MTGAAPAGPVVIGVDVGGTKVLAGVVAQDGTIQRTARGATPGRRVSPAMLEQAVVETVLEAAGGQPLAAVGIAAAGFVDRAQERVVFAPHLPWQGEPVRELLSQRLQAPVALDNDANCAALAEWTHGAGQGAATVVLITLGTGIGGGIVINGRLYRGRNGMAGEFGHMRVVPDGRECECGRSGCWEQYSSGNALVRHVRERLRTQPTGLVDLVAGNADAVTGPMITRAAAEGDPLALEAFHSVGDWLGVGAANLVAAIDPHRLIVGGGVADAGDLLLEPARLALERTLVGAEHRLVPRLIPAALGPEAGLVGASLLARAQVADHNRAPSS